MCRKAQGTAFAANAPVEASRFRLVQGEPVLRAYRSSPRKVRSFCSVCGSPIHSRHDTRPDVLRLRIGTLDTPITARPAQHIHVASKAAWYEIRDVAPQHAGFEPDRSPDAGASAQEGTVAATPGANSAMGGAPGDTPS